MCEREFTPFWAGPQVTSDSTRPSPLLARSRSERRRCLSCGHRTSRRCGVGAVEATAAGDASGETTARPGGQWSVPFAAAEDREWMCKRTRDSRTNVVGFCQLNEVTRGTTGSGGPTTSTRRTSHRSRRSRPGSSPSGTSRSTCPVRATSPRRRWPATSSSSCRTRW